MLTVDQKRELLDTLGNMDLAEYSTKKPSLLADLELNQNELYNEYRRRRKEAAKVDDWDGDIVEPCPYPVNGDDLLQELTNIYIDHVVLPEGAAEILATWTLYTHAFDYFGITPYLLITSATKQCGKTTLMKLLRMMTYRGDLHSGSSSACIFRMIEKWHPTLLCDEFERWGKSEEGVGILNSGHDRGGAFIWRLVIVDQNYEPKKFSTWAPKAFAQIGKKIESTLLDRSIHIRLSKKKAGIRKTRLPSDGSVPSTIRPLAGKCARWAQDNLSLLALGLPATKLDNRSEDNWTPLLKVAMAAGGTWYSRLVKIAERYSDAASEHDQDRREGLLHDVYGLFGAKGVDRLSGEEIARALGDMEDKPYAEWKSGKNYRPISKYQVSRELSEFNINSGPVRFTDGRKTVNGYHLDDFKEAIQQYPLRTPSELINSLHFKQGNGLGDFQLITPNSDVTSSTGEKGQELNACNKLMSSNGGVPAFCDDEGCSDGFDDEPEPLVDGGSS